MFESGGIKMQMCFFVDGSKYTVCKMLDEEAIAIYLPRKPHTFWTRPPKNIDKQFFCLVGMKVHFSWETNIACRRQSQKCIDWGLGDGNGGGEGASAWGNSAEGSVRQSKHGFPLSQGQQSSTSCFLIFRFFLQHLLHRPIPLSLFSALLLFVEGKACRVWLRF